MNSISEIFRSLIRGWKKHAVLQTMTLVTLTFTYLIVIITLIFTMNMKGALSSWGDQFQMTIFLEDSVSKSDVAKIKKSLVDLETISEIKFVSKKTALSRFKSELSQYAPTFLEEKEFSDALPASFEASLVRGTLNSSLETHVDQIRQWAGVEDISFGQSWLENYGRLVQLVSRSGWFFVSVMMMGALLVVGNAIRVSVNQRREEIDILGLIGATRPMIRRPFLIEGGFLGFVAAGMALVLGEAIFSVQSQMIAEEAAFMGFLTKISYLSLFQCVVTLVLGAAIGTLGAMVCVHRSYAETVDKV